MGCGSCDAGSWGGPRPPAKRIPAELENLRIDGGAFSTRLCALEAAFIAHAASDERLNRLLGAAVDRRRLRGMKKVVDLAESVAPTRAHPGLEFVVATLLAGPFAAVADRVRDGILEATT